MSNRKQTSSTLTRRPSIDVGIKASLATLELVKHTSKDGRTLSNDEVESAHTSLDQIIRTAESIKEKLPSSLALDREIDSVVSKSRKGSDASSLTPPASVVRKAEKGSSRTKKPPDPHKEPAGSSEKDESGEPRRRLSTPCLIPMGAGGKPGVSLSWW